MYCEQSSYIVYPCSCIVFWLTYKQLNKYVVLEVWSQPGSTSCHMQHQILLTQLKYFNFKIGPKLGTNITGTVFHSIKQWQPINKCLCPKKLQVYLWNPVLYIDYNIYNTRRLSLLYLLTNEHLRYSVVQKWNQSQVQSM